MGPAAADARAREAESAASRTKASSGLPASAVSRGHAAPAWIGPLVLLPLAGVLLASVAGGLLRAGVALGDGAVLGRAAIGHAALMIGAFFGTLIGIEGAVALRRGAAWIVPGLSAAAGIAWLGGAASMAGTLWLAASLGLVSLGAWQWRRQPTTPAALRLAGASCWLLGNACWLAGASGDATSACWLGFLVLTIVAERLERARPARGDAPAQRRLWAIVGALSLAVALGIAAPILGALLYGGALVALAAWLARHDVGRRLLRAGNAQQRYIAACLLSADAWLGVAGLAWAANALGAPARDIALHALGLGFVVAMLIGHAPLVLPAMARVKVRHGAFFYAPLGLLQVSLLLRFAGDAIDPAWRAAGAWLNAATLALFVLAVVGGARAWRRREAANFPP